MKKYVSIGVGIAVLAALSACSSPSTGTGSTQEQTLKFITFSGGDAGKKYVDLIAGFETANPGVTVKMEVLPADDTYNQAVTSRIQGGSSPDIFEDLNSLAGGKPYVDAGLLTDLSDQSWVDSRIPVVKQSDEYFGGKTYLYISQMDVSGVFYNKDIFAKAGLSVPTNWDEFTDVANKLRQQGITPLGVGGKDGWPLVTQALSMAATTPKFGSNSKDAAGLADSSAKFSSSSQWRQVLTDFQALVSQEAYDPNASGIAFADSANAFGTGETAMFIQGTYALPAIRAAGPSINIGMFTLPYGNSDAAVSIGYGGLLAIPKEAPNADLAKKFLDYLSEPAVLAQYLTTAAAFSPQTGTTPKLDPAVSEISDVVAKNAVESSLASGITAPTQAALQAGAQAILAGSGSVDDALAGMDRAQTAQ